MSDQPKLDRLLRLLMMLSGGFGNTLNELAGKLEISPRSIYRYIDTLRNTGFIIIKKDEYFYVDKNSPYLKSIGDLLHFTKEESWILNRAILALDDETVIKQNLAKKLYALYDLKGVPYPVVKKENSEKVVSLIRAIEDNCIVILTGYHSSNSNKIRDRKVEPFEFTLNYSYIWCYEHESRTNKLFKTTRIEKVIDSGQPWKFESLHCSEPTDVFRISGKKKVHVELQLTLRAANLLTEEYPMAEEYIEPFENNWFVFKGEVSSFEGIGRFILGLMDEIKVINPKAFKDYLNRRITGKKF